MKFQMRKLIALLLAVVLLGMTAACALEDDTSSGTKVYSARERAKVAVKIGDDYTITKGDIIDTYNSYVSMYEYYGMTAPTADEDIETMQDMAVESLVAEKLLLYQADQQGITLTEEQTAEIETQVEEEMAYWTDYFTSQAESEGAEDVEARMIEIFNEELAASGLDLDMDGYEDYIRDAYTKEAILTALEEAYKATITITDEEVQEYYDNLLDTQKETYEATPSSYQSDQEAYEMSGGTPVVYVPEGYMRVRTITVSPAEDVAEEYTTLCSDMETLEAEYGKLLLKYGLALLDIEVTRTEEAATEETEETDEAATEETDETATEETETTEEEESAVTYTAVNAPSDEMGEAAERLAEITDTYNEKKTASEELYEDYLKDAREKIGEALKALQDGESFTDVLTEYGEDDMYTTYPTFMEKGILMLREGEQSMDAALVEAALALEPGAYSDIIQVDDMFYIISPVGDEPAGVKDLTEVEDEIRAQALTEKQETAWTEQQAAWTTDTSIVEYNEDVYRDIGK